MTNDLRWLPLSTILNGGKDLYRGAHMHPLGQPNRGSADPMGLAVAPDGKVIVTLGGVGEIALGQESDFSLQRVKVQQRPTFVVITQDSRHAWVLNTFSDSLSCIALDNGEVVRTVPLGVMPALSQAEQGEQLFYSGKLSLDGWMSCHSCHTDGHSNGQKNDNFSDKTFGAPKRVLSLLTTTDSAPFGWRGTAKTLEEQIKNSVFHTMQGGEAKGADVAALAAYLKTLTPPPSIDVARGAADKPGIARGQALFTSLKCSRCHVAPSYTSPDVQDVGLADELEHRDFNPPSLLGVGQRGPYFHDGRAAQLKDIFTEHKHQVDRLLTDDELSDLVKFLRSL
jgi:cytochrome c peroxidase